MNPNVKVKIALTNEQSVKIRRAGKGGRSATIRLSNAQLFNESGVDVELSPSQYKRVLSAHRSAAKRGVQLTFTQEQIGGFIGALLGTIAKAAAVAAKTAAKVAPKVVSTASKLAPQIAKAAPSVAKNIAQGALIAAGGEAVSAIANKIASDKMAAQQAQLEQQEQPTEEQKASGLVPLGSRRGKGLVPLGGRGLVPLGSQRGKALMTYPSKKKAAKKSKMM